MTWMMYARYSGQRSIGAFLDQCEAPNKPAAEMEAVALAIRLYGRAPRAVYVIPKVETVNA